MANREQKIRAIETQYKGYRFRSRLEARWAVFFDALGLAWEYESQGFELASGRYLPDFWLPGLDAFFEVKPAKPWEGETSKCIDLAVMTGKAVFIAHGNIPSPNDGTCDAEIIDAIFPSAGFAGDSWEVDGWAPGEYSWDTSYAFCECSECGCFGIEYGGRIERARHLAGCSVSKEHKVFAGDTERIKAAYSIARSARFEFGESGAQKIIGRYTTSDDVLMWMAQNDPGLASAMEACAREMRRKARGGRDDG